MKTLKQLYTILYNNIKDKKQIDGLCYEIDKLEHSKSITRIEGFKLYNHFKSQKPSNTQHTEFTEGNTWTGGTWWWSYIEDKNPVNRIAFIKKLKDIEWGE